MFEHVHPYDPLLIPADTWNKVQDAAKAYLKDNSKTSDVTQQFDKVYFRNDTGSNLNAFDVVGIETPTVLPVDAATTRQFKYHFTLTGVSPQIKHINRFGILQAPCLAGRIAQIVVDGLTVAKVNVSDSTHTYAEIEVGVTSSLKSGKTGSAIILWKESGTGVKWALVRIDATNTLKVKQGEPCSNACVEGTPTENLIFDGKGLKVHEPTCNDIPNTKIVRWKGVEVAGQACGAGSPGTSSFANKIVAKSPLSLTGGGTEDCPDTAELSLPNDLVTGRDGQCINVNVSQSGCKYEVSADLNLSLLAGNCISIDTNSQNSCEKTINNTMNLIGGNCISVSGSGCNKTIASTLDLVAGDCISISANSQNSCEKTITNTMSVTGGNGIIVTKSGCVYSVSMDVENSDKTSFSVLCDVDISITPIAITCVESSGGYQFQVTGGVLTLTKKYTNITLPEAVVKVSGDCPIDQLPTPPSGCSTCSECTTYEDKIYNPTTSSCDCIAAGSPLPYGYEYCDTPKAVPSCSDCADCTTGYRKVINISTGACQCILTNDATPSGYTDCGSPEVPDGQGIQFNGLSCAGQPPHFSFTFLGMPSGATSYVIDVVGNNGSHATVGPSYDHEEQIGMTYWGALNEGWGTPMWGECFTFNVTFSNGAMQTFTGCCEA
jgi:hypothetical protein